MKAINVTALSEFEQGICERFMDRRATPELAYEVEGYIAQQLALLGQDPEHYTIVAEIRDHNRLHIDVRPKKW